MVPVRENLKILEPLEEVHQIKNIDQEQRDIKILETYFLNALPKNLAKQEVVKLLKKKPQDISKPNELIISYGIDFD